MYGYVRYISNIDYSLILRFVKYQLPVFISIYRGMDAKHGASMGVFSVDNLRKTVDKRLELGILRAFVRIIAATPPPYLAWSASKAPDGETLFGSAKTAVIAHTLSPSGLGIKSSPVSPAFAFVLTHCPTFTGSAHPNPLFSTYPQPLLLRRKNHL